MKRAKGPSSLHSPFSAPGLDSAPDVEFMGEVGVMVEMGAEDAAMYDKVGKKTISTISAGNECAAGVGRSTSSGDIDPGMVGRPAERRQKMSVRR